MIKEIVFTGPDTKTLRGGNFLRVISSSADVDIEFKNNNTRLDEKAEGVVEGDYFDFTQASREGDRYFDHVTITSAAAQTVVIHITDGKSGSARLSGSVSVAGASGLQSAADVSIAATSTQQVIAQNLSRKKLHLANLSNSVSLRWGDAATTAARGGLLHPGMVVEIENTAAVYVYNPDAAPVDVAIVEET